MNQVNESNNEFAGVYNFGEFMKLAIEKPKAAIAGFLYEGQTTMLAGRFAVGKTLLTTQMAIHMAAGKPFLGRTIERPYKVAFIDCENGPAEIQSRWQQQMSTANLGPDERGHLEANCFYANAKDVEASLYGLQLEEGRTAQLEAFLNFCKADFVILDNLGRVIHGDLEDTKDVTTFFKVVQGVKERCPSVSGFLFLHHLKKPSEHGGTCTLFSSPYEYLTQMRGSGRLLDFSEGRFALAEEKLNNESFFVLNGIARSAKVAPLVLERDEQTLTFQLVEDKRFLLDTLFRDRPKGKELIEIMQKAGEKGHTFTQLTKLSDADGKPFNRTTLSSTLSAAVSNGLIIHEGNTYSLTKELY